MKAVSVAFVDPIPAQCRNVSLFAGRRDEVELCGAFSKGQDLLDALYDGMRPQVIVVDQQLADLTVFALVRAIRMLEAGYMPRVLLTVPVPLDGRTYDLLLTYGVKSFILKPYTLPQLFETAFMLAATPETITSYRIRAACEEQLNRMRASPSLNGRRYLERMLCEGLESGGGKNLKELYHVAARAENLSDNAVASGLKRLAEQICLADTPAYRQMCRESGNPPGMPLSNGTLYRCLSDLISRVLAN